VRLGIMGVSPAKSVMPSQIWLMKNVRGVLSARIKRADKGGEITRIKEKIR